MQHISPPTIFKQAVILDCISSSLYRLRRPLTNNFISILFQTHDVTMVCMINNLATRWVLIICMKIVGWIYYEVDYLSWMQWSRQIQNLGVLCISVGMVVQDNLIILVLCQVIPFYC